MATTIKHAHGALAPAESFVRRHIGPTEADVAEMLAALGYDSMDALIDATIPAGIRYRGGLNLPDGRSEHQSPGAETSRGVHSVLNCHSYEHHNQAR